MEILPTPTKGTADWRDYRAVKLANGLTLLLVHDATSRNSSAACAVSVGASSDPPSKPGLAHFCEHMCFLGSEKYPGENHYKELLSLHGGGSNASTSMDYTNYKFHILAPFFEEALDVFSNFLCRKDHRVPLDRKPIRTDPELLKVPRYVISLH